MKRELKMKAELSYYNPIGVCETEYKKDLDRTKSLKRLLNRHIDKGDLQSRLILNHLIIIFNVFPYNIGLEILRESFDSKYFPALKPFLVFLNIITPTNEEYINVESDKTIEASLKEI